MGAFVKINNISSVLSSGKKALTIVNKSIGTMVNSPSSYGGVNKNITSANFNQASLEKYQNNASDFMCGVEGVPWGSHNFKVGS
jgi:hypothetical protein